MSVCRGIYNLCPGLAGCDICIVMVSPSLEAALARPGSPGPGSRRPKAVVVAPVSGSGPAGSGGSGCD